VFLAALTFGQQQNVTPVPVTGSQNPAYQITSEKEQGQTYSTNFHAISMMPAYRNASFEVHTHLLSNTNERNYDLRIMHKVDVMEREVRSEHPLHSEEHQLARQTRSVDSVRIQPIPEQPVRLDNPLRRILPVHLVQERLDQTRLPVDSVPTLQPMHSAKPPLNPQPLVQVQQVHLDQEPQPADSDLLRQQVDSVNPTQQVPLVKNPVPSPSAVVSAATTPIPQDSVVQTPVQQAHSVLQHQPQAAHSEPKLLHLKPTHGLVSVRQPNNLVEGLVQTRKIRKINLRSVDLEGRILLRRRLRRLGLVPLDRNLRGRDLERDLVVDRLLGRIRVRRED